MRALAMHQPQPSGGDEGSVVIGLIEKFHISLRSNVNLLP